MLVTHNKAEDFVSCFGYGERASDFCRATTIHNAVIFDKVANDTQRVMERSFRLINNLHKLDARQRGGNHLIASADKDCHRACICTFLDNEHSVTRSAKL